MKGKKYLQEEIANSMYQDCEELLKLLTSSIKTMNADRWENVRVKLGRMVK